MTIATILSITALFSLASIEKSMNPWRLYLYGVAFGFGTGLQLATIFAGAADMFYGKHFGAIVGLLLAGMGVGGAIGPWLGGYIYDYVGNYIIAFRLAMFSIALACVSFFFAAPRKAVKLYG